MEVARLLLDSGAQVNMPADSFESPLTLAACGGHVELAALLIERGANLEEVCKPSSWRLMVTITFIPLKKGPCFAAVLLDTRTPICKAFICSITTDVLVFCSFFVVPQFSFFFKTPKNIGNLLLG